MPAELKSGQLADGSWEGRGFTLMRDPVARRNWHELWLSPDNAEAFWERLQAAGGSPVGAEALEWQRILLGLPRIGVDIRGNELVQETGQDHALHAAKGCYIGQEIVERVRSRGQVHRMLSGLIVEGALPSHGSKIMAGEKEVGEVASSAEVVVDGVARRVALGYVRRGAADALQVEGNAAKLVPLPFQF
jgi:folate-binding protein YgfZ